MYLVGCAVLRGTHSNMNVELDEQDKLLNNSRRSLALIVLLEDLFNKTSKSCLLPSLIAVHKKISASGEFNLLNILY